MPASARLAAASAVAASLSLFSQPASAADLYPYDYGEAPARYERYAEPPADFEPPYPPRYAERCVPREVVRDRLFSEGWGDFRDFEPRGQVVLIQARRPSGRLFDLTIDRCSGEIVDARPVFGGRLGPGPYAYGNDGPYARGPYGRGPYARGPYGRGPYGRGPYGPGPRRFADAPY